LLFYEQNNISNFKEIFINQFEFTVRTYFQDKRKTSYNIYGLAGCVALTMKPM